MLLYLFRLESRRKRPFGPRLEFSAEEAVKWQLDALKYNDQPRQDYGIEVMYRVCSFVSAISTLVAYVSMV
ncbi:hypothetical protein B296_00030746 [Ensete ventricosum]|uniref:Uncharacterized protein n=1 Tax=Ensete ventricosum TaxID=4639 RepID=A0A426XUY9_ENSVE|nr:hypothetical protein B296_00030746 [Ensete ventricosum]